MYQTSGASLPSFMLFDIETLILTVFTEDETLIGTYELEIKASVTGFVTEATHEFTVIVELRDNYNNQPQWEVS